ncbi:MAG: hypothetical protein AB2768_09080 [Candidatus Thiodiazotropha endolucinida]
MIFFPAGTRRRGDVVLTLMRRIDGNTTLFRRRGPAVLLDFTGMNVNACP